MGMLMDVIKSFSDMKKLGKLVDVIDEEMKKLEADGKLPAELKTAFEAVKNVKGDGKSTTPDQAIKPLEDFAAQLEKYENLFPENIKSIVDKFESVTKDLEGVAGDITSKTAAK